MDKYIYKVVKTVSIHTPVWGVTLAPIVDFRPFGVSIHTPVWGVTARGCD